MHKLREDLQIPMHNTHTRYEHKKDIPKSTSKDKPPTKTQYLPQERDPQQQHKIYLKKGIFNNNTRSTFKEGIFNTNTRSTKREGSSILTQDLPQGRDLQKITQDLPQRRDLQNTRSSSREGTPITQEPK